VKISGIGGKDARHKQEKVSGHGIEENKEDFNLWNDSRNECVVIIKKIE